jgi:hypothetical protein
MCHAFHLVEKALFHPPPVSLPLPPTLQILHILIVFLIKDRHVAILYRCSSVIKGMKNNDPVISRAG